MSCMPISLVCCCILGPSHACLCASTSVLHLVCLLASIDASCLVCVFALLCCILAHIPRLHGIGMHALPLELSMIEVELIVCL